MGSVRKAIPVPSVGELAAARQQFVRREPRGLFYRVATELIDLSLKGTTAVSLAEALAVLLQTWNRQYYRFNRRDVDDQDNRQARTFDEHDFRSIELLLESNRRSIETYRGRSIGSLVSNEMGRVTLLFARFARVLGPVGAAKSLHLLAPSFFPLWDQKIAEAYGFGRRSPNDYGGFMEIVQNQYCILRENGAPWNDLLKAIDEYNYCKYTLDPDQKRSVEPDLRPAEEPQRDIESMTDAEIDHDLAEIIAMEAARSEEQRSRARQRAKEGRDLLKELKRMRANGDLMVPDLGD